MKNIVMIKLTFQYVINEINNDSMMEKLCMHVGYYLSLIYRPHPSADIFIAASSMKTDVKK